MCLQTVWTALTTISFISPVGDVVTEAITKPEPGRSLHSQVFKSKDILIICPARPSTISCVLHVLYVCSLMALAHEPAKRRRQSRSPNRCCLGWLGAYHACRDRRTSMDMQLIVKEQQNRCNQQICPIVENSNWQCCITERNRHAYIGRLHHFTIKMFSGRIVVVQTFQSFTSIADNFFQKPQPLRCFLGFGIVFWATLNRECGEGDRFVSMFKCISIS